MAAIQFDGEFGVVARQEGLIADVAFHVILQSAHKGLSRLI